MSPYNLRPRKLIPPPRKPWKKRVTGSKVSGKSAVNPLSTNRDQQDVTRRTFPPALRREQKDKQYYKRLAERLAATSYVRNQPPVKDQERPVHPNQTITSPTPTVTVKTESCSVSKVVDQTSVDASNFVNMPRQHSQSTGSTMEHGPRNQQDNVQQPISKASTGPELQNESTLALRWALRKKGLDTKLTAEEVTKIQLDIQTVINRHLDNNTLPRFEDCNLNDDGALIIHCANNATVLWLLRIIATNTKVFGGLRLVKASNLPNIKVAYKTRDILTSDPIVFLKRLHCQNPKLHTQYWMTVEGPTMELGLQRWIFKIDQLSADVIKASNMTAYTGLFKGTFEFLSDVESPTEIVIKQEADTPLLICID